MNYSSIVIEQPKSSVYFYLTSDGFFFSQWTSLWTPINQITAPHFTYLFIYRQSDMDSFPWMDSLDQPITNGLTWVTRLLQLTLTHSYLWKSASNYLNINSLKSHLSFFIKHCGVNFFFVFFLSRRMTSMFTIKVTFEFK